MIFTTLSWIAFICIIVLIIGFVLSYTIGTITSNIKKRKPKKVHTSSINDNQNITLYLNPLSDVNLVCDDIDPKLIVDSARLKLQDDNVNDFSSESSSSYSESVYEYSDSFERKLEQNLEWDSENNNSDIDDIWISNEKMRREGSNWSLYNMV